MRAGISEQEIELMETNITSYFEDFLKNISLGRIQLKRMDVAANAVESFLINSYGLDAQKVFVQGSYANKTVVKPINNGEYDIDVVAICCDTDITCGEALNELQTRLSANGNYSKRIEPRKSCIRLHYAESDVGLFHLDVTPLRVLPNSASLEAPRKSEKWKPTAPAEYRDWCTNQGELFRRTVMMLKRWRSEQQAEQKVIKSIVLQVLIADSMPKVSDDATRIAETFRNLYAKLGSLAQPPVVLNPVLSVENLSKNWTAEDFRDFVAELKEATELVAKAEGSSDVVEAANAWNELFGEGFPIPTAEELGLKLGDTSHALKASDMDWAQALEPALSVVVEGTWKSQKRGRRPVPFESGDTISPNRDLHFQIVSAIPPGTAIWWQVVNTGAAAKAKDEMRGEIFKGRDLQGFPLTDETQNWEQSAFEGVHEIRALLVRGKKLIAKSEYFIVKINRTRK
jgi:hypothetical protein